LNDRNRGLLKLSFRGNPCATRRNFGTEIIQVSFAPHLKATYQHYPQQ
jgi:hypothetical protein